MLVMAIALTASDASAEEPVTRESCIAYLSADSNGPRLNPNQLRIGTIVSYDGLTQTIYEGMTLETICDSVAARRQELLSKDRVITQLRTEKETLSAQGAQDRAFRKRTESEFVRRHPYEIALFAGFELILILFVTFYACFGKKMAEYSRRRSRRGRRLSFGRL